MTRTALAVFFVIFVVINAESPIHGAPRATSGIPPSSLPGFGNREISVGEGSSLQDQASGGPRPVAPER